MTTQSGNPFFMPGMGLGATPEHLAGNPVLQSMDLMRQAWTTMGSGVGGALPTPPMANPEELDKRIAELRAVENWLRMNLNMLTSSIQAMEVQSATIGTLRSFAQSMTAGAASAGQSASPADGASPLEVVLGLKPGAAPQARQAPVKPAPAEPTPEPVRAAAPEAPPADEAAAAPAGDAGLPSHQAWWDLLQDQFNRIAVAAAASMPKTPTADAATSEPDAKAPASAESAAPRRAAAPRKASASKAGPRKAAPRKRSSAPKA